MEGGEFLLVTLQRIYSSLSFRLTSVLSMNAAVAAAVVLASRLKDDISVFALMVFSIQIFALLPILRTRLLVST